MTAEFSIALPGTPVPQPEPKHVMRNGKWVTEYRIRVRDGNGWRELPVLSETPVSENGK